MASKQFTHNGVFCRLCTVYNTYWEPVHKSYLKIRHMYYFSTILWCLVMVVLTIRIRDAHLRLYRVVPMTCLKSQAVVWNRQVCRFSCISLSTHLMHEGRGHTSLNNNKQIFMKLLDVTLTNWYLNIFHIILSYYDSSEKNLL